MRITTLHTPLGADSFGNDVLVFRELEGREALNSLFEYKLTMHSSKADIAAKDLLGKTLTVGITDQTQNVRYLNATIAEFRFIGGDQRRTIYEAKLVPWLSLATLSADCRIFQNLNPVQIITQVLGSYPFPIKQKLADQYPSLAYCVQYNESDFAFVSRLMERFGIGYYFEHTSNAHTLVLTDVMSVFKAMDGHANVPFRAPDAVSVAKEETIHRWNPNQSLKSGSFSTDDYWYRAPFAHLEQLGTGTAAPKQHEFSQLPVYKWQGQGHYQDANTGAGIVKLKQDQQHQQFQAISAESNVRAFVAGSTGSLFTLTDHPESAMNQQVLIVETMSHIKENASTTGDGDQHTDWKTSFVAIPAKLQYRPQLRTALPHISGPQTAIVTGASGQEIWTNDLGEVKLRFLWDRYSSGDENSSCWIRVCSTWAGDSWGSEAVPRIGTEVIVNYLDGNPDYPIVIGRVVNSNRLPPTFSNTGALPGNQALAGMKSRELQGNRYNQWLFDDTPGQIRMQLESEHAKTQLNMGYLVHPRNESASPRGEGFELRTDAWGTLRAAKGIFISTDGRHAAVGNSLSREELINCLETALSLAKELNGHAQDNQGTPGDQAPQEFQSNAVKDWGLGSNAEGEGSGGAALFAVSAEAGIALSTPRSTTVASGKHIDMVAQQNQQLTAGERMNLHARKSISIYAHDGGIKSIAHKGKNIIHAQDDDIEIAANKSVVLTASQADITVAAKKHVTLTSGGGYIKMADGNIELHCPGTISMKAANYDLMGPASMPYEFPFQPPKGPFSNRLDAYDLFLNHDFSQISYKSMINHVVTSGSLDEHGRTNQIYADDAHKAKVLVGSDPDEWDTDVELADTDSSSSQGSDSGTAS